MHKRWTMGFLGFLGFLAIPGLLRGEWLSALWFVWFLWFLYFIPEKKV